ncbi:hypothetical protein NX059_010465 [Plenodomus lindquistii]|nr:hypothetical protein NX059_010465 [Plenodomus lindquistii]
MSIDGLLTKSVPYVTNQIYCLHVSLRNSYGAAQAAGNPSTSPASMHGVLSAIPMAEELHAPYAAQAGLQIATARDVLMFMQEDARSQVNVPYVKKVCSVVQRMDF